MIIRRHRFVFSLFIFSSLMATTDIVCESAEMMNPPSVLIETLPPLHDGVPPQSFEELWAGFDPRAEPLDIEILKEWEEDGVVLQILRYRIGVFKGRKAMMAAVYAYPKGNTALPGLVQIHGGGQYAHYNACLRNAKRGYATISISWGGRIDAPGYRVTPAEVKLFWAGETDHPDYKVITDWGALDAYHHPNRNEKNANWGDLSPAAWTLDSVESPRNSNWFLCALGARRALTFLERQAEVDGDKLGVYGHSMGGKLTMMTAGTDDRVKAAAPSCGGISDRGKDDEMLEAAIGDAVYLQHISCPIIFLSPANDFHGRIDDLPASIDEIQTSEWRITSSAHHNHQDTPEYEVATLLWMDQHLQETFALPQTPQTELALKTDNGVPSLEVKPDTSKPILYVDVYYTQQGKIQGQKEDRDNTMNRFWHHAPAIKEGNTWTADLPVFSTEKPLWAYANAVYPLDEPITGAGYYYATYTATKFNLSSLVHLISAEQLQAAGVEATLGTTPMIETFASGWQKQWFTYRPGEWARTTHKVYDPRWTAPQAAKIALEIRSAQPNKLVVGLDESAAEVALKGGPHWQSVVLSATDFRNAADEPMENYAGIRTLKLGAEQRLQREVDGEQKVIELGAKWKGAAPEFKNLQWMR